MKADDLKPRLEELWRLPIVPPDTTPSAAPRPQWVCACADEAGASYYASRHNRSAEDDIPILITFQAEPADAVVDGRDFLFTLFQRGDPAKARPVAEYLFGSGILRYIDRAWATDSQEQRIALCRLAVQDDAVIEDHAANRTVIAGRLGTVFRNAFLVRLPIAAERIIDVRTIAADTVIPDAEVVLPDILVR
jgi:hypothetical protein